MPNRHHQGTLVASILLACTGWLGMYFMVQTVLPQAGARWLFFVLLYLASAGTIIPIAQLFNHRLRGRRPPPPDWVSVRQGLWVGLYVSICAWLQIPRELNPVIAFFLALSLIVIEIFLRVRERSQYGY